MVSVKKEEEEIFLELKAQLFERPSSAPLHYNLGLAYARGGHQQHVVAVQHRRYRFALSPGRLGYVLVLQHLADAGVQQFEYHLTFRQ